MENLIIEFSKTNKIGRAKAQAFAERIIEQYRTENPSKGNAGRPVSDQTMQLRGNVVQAVETLQKQGKKATTKTIAEVIGGNPNKVYLCNALNYMQAQGKLVRVGKDTDKVGKGKKPVLWGVKV